MMRLGNRSIRSKVTIALLSTSAAVLLLSASAFIGYEYVNFRTDLVRNLTTQAAITAESSTALLAFGDEATARETLAVLRSDPHILGAVLYRTNGTRFAEYRRDAPDQGASGPGDTWPVALPTVAPPPGVVFTPTHLEITRPIVMGGRPIGSIHLASDLVLLRQRVARYVVTTAAVLVAALLVVLWLSSRFQRIISDPIRALASAATAVAAERRYETRVSGHGHDELGTLVTAFNDMLSQVQERDAALRAENAERRQAEDEVRRLNTDLERRVRERTTQLEASNAALLSAKEAAEAASRAKSAFLANMSHELRTPLNAVIGYAELLMEDATAEGRTETVADLRKIQTAGKHLLGLINDVLDLSKIEVGKMRLDVREFALAQLVGDVLSTARGLAEKNGNVLDVASLDGLGTMTTDPTRVSQVLLNLLGNAAKFTHQGRIRFDVTRERLDGRAEVVFRIADTGIGMTPEQVSQVFREFTQADNSTSRLYGGTGLGLTISRRLCTLMGGEIGVDSRVGEGSVFTVRLPSTITLTETLPGDESTGARPTHGPARAAATPRVLVVDDDAEFREIVARQLAKMDIELLSAGTAAEGLRQARASRPDVIVLDVELPDAKGWEVLRVLKSSDELRTIPVVIASVVDDRARGEALGAAASLTKPIDPEMLRAAIRHWSASDDRRPAAAPTPARRTGESAA